MSKTTTLDFQGSFGLTAPNQPIRSAKPERPRLVVGHERLSALNGL